VAARKARGEVNVPPPSPGRSYRQIILGNIFSFINNVFYVLCLLLVLLGRPLDAILPLVVVLANAGVSVFQEVRAKRKLDQIALLTARRRRSSATVASRASTLARSSAATYCWSVRETRSLSMGPWWATERWRWTSRS
jgi:magnesium-transporting ATPase (P-type)